MQDKLLGGQAIFLCLALRKIDDKIFYDNIV